MARRVVEGGGFGRPAGHQRLQQQLGRERARRRQQRQRHRIPSPHDHPGGRGGGQDPHDGEPSQPVRDLLGQPELVVGTGAEPVLDPRVQAWELLGVPDEPGDQGGDENGEDGRGRRPRRSQQGVTRRNEDRAAAPCVTAGHGSTGPHPVLSTSGNLQPAYPGPPGRFHGPVRAGQAPLPGSRDPERLAPVLTAGNAAAGPDGDSAAIGRSPRGPGVRPGRRLPPPWGPAWRPRWRASSGPPQPVARRQGRRNGRCGSTGSGVWQRRRRPLPGPWRRPWPRRRPHPWCRRSGLVRGGHRDRSSPGVSSSGSWATTSKASSRSTSTWRPSARRTSTP